MFGLLAMLIGGIGRLGNSVSKTVEDERTRDEARREGREYYWANDGQRRVSDNHKIARGSYGIIDATTGEYIVDKSELERQKDREYEEENRVSKQEAIIKGKNTYSWKRRTGSRDIDWDFCSRLISNDMPIQEYEEMYWNPDKKEVMNVFKMHKIHQKEHWIFYLYKERNFDFLCPIQFTDEELKRKTEDYETRTYSSIKNEWWNNIVEIYKKENIKMLVKKINIYPINEVKWMHQYCFKYNIPMGTWEEVEKACWEEHPVKWGKPASDSYYFKQFVERKF